ALSGAVLDRTRFIPAADLDGGHLTNGAALGGLPAGVTPVSTLGGLSPQASDTVGPAVGKPVSTGVEKMHPVLKGETLASIAQKYYGDKGLSKDLGAYNAKRLTAGGSVREGVTLRVPPKDVLLGTATLGLNAAGRSDVGSVPPGPARTKPSADKPAAGKATAGKPASRGPRTYTIKKGDTLTAIASRELGSAKRWEMLVAANPHLDEESLRPGMSIKIPASK
ncbi:MAG: LysM peptidoglycan-binding domain-containing protein, partial [Thermoleophilia bacterium]|nr:LysM peptidoglycan-binding domain-containing protein [Thermoleophilia bacterium]